MTLISQSRRRAKLVGITTLGLMAVFVCAAAWAAPPAWPARKGELCWEADADGEISLVIAQVTNMGNGHYVFHGQGFRSDIPPLGPLQPFDGSAEVDASDANDIRVIGMITKTEIRPAANGDPRTFEVYSGQFNLDYETLDGVAEGIIYICPMPPTQVEPAPCEFITTGEIEMTRVACP